MDEYETVAVILIDAASEVVIGMLHLPIALIPRNGEVFEVDTTILNGKGREKRLTNKFTAVGRELVFKSSFSPANKWEDAYEGSLETEVKLHVSFYKQR